MSALGSIIAGIAVAAGGVFIGRRLEQMRTSLDDAANGQGKTTNQSPEKIIDAEKDPITGAYRQKGK